MTEQIKKKKKNIIVLSSMGLAVVLLFFISLFVGSSSMKFKDAFYALLK